MGRRGGDRGLGLFLPVVCLGFGQWDVADGLQQSVVVEPRNPLQGGHLGRFACLPGPAPVDDLGLVQPVDGLSQLLAVADRDVLRAAVAVVHQGSFTPRPARVQRLPQRVEHEVGLYRAVDSPADDVSGKDIDDEGHVHEALPGRDLGEIRNPQLVRSLGLEVPVDLIQRTRRLGVGYGRAHRLAAAHALQPVQFHQPLDGTARHRCAFSPQLPPDLVCAVDPQVLLIPALYLLLQQGGRGQEHGVALARRAPRAADGATCSPRQIGSTPQRARCSSMKAFTS